MAEYMKKASKNLQASQELQKQWHDQKAVLVQYQPGQKVWVLEPVAPRALQDKWSGPHIIVEKKGEVTYLVDLGTARSPLRVLHVNRLKPYYDRADLTLLMATDEGQEEESDPLPDLFSSTEQDALVEGVVLADCLTAEQKDHCINLLGQFSELFSTVPGTTSWCEHTLDTGDSLPVKSWVLSYLGGHSDRGGRRSLPAKRFPPKDRFVVKRPRRPFRLSRWAGGRPPEDRRPAQRECPFNNEAGSEWSRRSCRGATGAVAPVAIFAVCTADSDNLCGALLGGPCTAHASVMGSAGAPRGPTAPVPAILVLAVDTARNRLAGRRSESPRRCCKQRHHGGFPGPAGNRRETAGSPFLTAALPPWSESPRKHRQPVGGASAALRHGGHGPPGSE
ncbi:hypothetical protein NDU88_007303 [Pleurodeles waltl]|uniref:Integrase p58-like C-terminal domain-containing protein n=1 Tax=Pleurodeles waltl TaxID=8319 RepID=A0AAV7PKV5_PLEWA|nr:hypothetical protein NDU88_007303 [Pleurodeles waltl]